MKKVLITGVNSYVGNSLADWLAQYPEDYEVEKISVRGEDWKEYDFSSYDSIVHVAGIVHHKETKRNNQLYYKINRDLTTDVAEKAKDEHVSQFIFLSTMSVYGLESGVIDESTPLKPKTHYGISKKEAEDSLLQLASQEFKVAIVRPPMIYGKNCPGNYQRLRKLALRTPIFPNFNNKRSMIYEQNLAFFLEGIINSSKSGFFLPQNREYVNTTLLVKEISELNNHRIFLSRIFNPIIHRVKLNIVVKVFGDLIYSDEISNKVSAVEFKDSIIKTEGLFK